MHKPGRITNYLLAVFFLVIGVAFLTTGLRNVASSLAADFFVARAVVALMFLLLFAVVAITYALFLIRNASEDTLAQHSPNMLDRVSPAKVISLLAFGLAPLLYVYMSTQSRELNSRRQAALQEIRPAMLRYMTDHGRVPGNLNLLVPDYLSALPELIVLNHKIGTDKWVRYRPEKNTALFCYKTGGFPAVEACYDIVNDRYQLWR